jgi:hypothetical protein
MNPDVMPASQGSGGGAPQDPVVDATHGGGDPAPEPVSTVGVAAASATLTMTESAIEVHPGLRAPRQVSLSEAVDTAHFALRHAHDVL